MRGQTVIGYLLIIILTMLLSITIITGVGYSWFSSIFITISAIGIQVSNILLSEKLGKK